MKRAINWFNGLKSGSQVAVIVGGLLSAFVFTAVVAAAVNPQPKPVPSQQPPGDSQGPTVEKKQEEEKSTVGFSTENQNDPNLPQGTTKTAREGTEGERTVTYEVTYTDGKQTDKKVLSDTVTRPPVNKIVTIGTYIPPPQPKCDPNYSGACVPIASDVDCAGGSGNGPAYVSGPVKVIGSDIYDLDRDGNGYGC